MNQFLHDLLSRLYDNEHKLVLASPSEKIEEDHLVNFGVASISVVRDERIPEGVFLFVDAENEILGGGVIADG